MSVRRVVYHRSQRRVILLA